MKISVLINTYNHARYLGACIESVLAQTRPADEIIVYDDGSADGAVDVLRAYERLALVRAIYGQRHSTPGHENQARAVHEAFRVSNGDWLFLLDGDDIFTPTKIERYVAAFARETPAPVMMQAPMRWIDPQGRTLRRLPETFKHVTAPLAAAYARQDPDLFYPTSGLAFSRKFLVSVLPIDWSDGMKLWLDTRLCLAALLAGPVVTLDEELGGWRQHAASDSARAQTSTYQLRQTLRRTYVFNRLAAQSGRAPLRVWRNPRFYAQLVRLAAPVFFYRWYERRKLQRAGAEAVLSPGT